MNIVYGIISSEKFKDSRVKWVEETWAKNEKHVFFSDYDEYPSIKLSDKKNYSFVAIKCIEGLYYFYKNFKNYDWFVICDDDTFIFTKNLRTLLSKYSENDNISFGKIIQAFPALPDLEYYSGGAGSVFSKRILEIMISYLDTNPIKFSEVFSNSFNRESKYYYGDVLIGDIMNKCGIKMTDLNYSIEGKTFYPFNLEPPQKLGFEMDGSTVSKMISFHHLDKNTMYLLNKIAGN